MISKIDFEKSISEQDWGWKTLWHEKQLFQRLVNVSATFDGKDKVTGDAFLMHKDYARQFMMSSVEQEPEKVTSYYVADNEAMKLKDVAIRNDKVDTLPLEQSFKFEIPVEQNGDYLSFNVNLFAGLDENEFLAEERYSDIFFGFGQKYTLRGSLTIPEGFQFEELPKSMKMVMPDKSVEMTRIFQPGGQTARYSIEVLFREPFYSPDNYDEFREFMKKMYSLLNEQVVIRKK